MILIWSNEVVCVCVCVCVCSQPEFTLNHFYFWNISCSAYKKRYFKQACTNEVLFLDLVNTFITLFFAELREQVCTKCRPTLTSLNAKRKVLESWLWFYRRRHLGFIGVWTDHIWQMSIRMAMPISWLTVNVNHEVTLRHNNSQLAIIYHAHTHTQTHTHTLTRCLSGSTYLMPK